jgi:hypothetical protein
MTAAEGGVANNYASLARTRIVWESEAKVIAAPIARPVRGRGGGIFVRNCDQPASTKRD